jgi:hypothetical protein
MDKLHLLALLFADDTALFAKSPGELQSLLDQLHRFCSKSGIAVNTGKTKIVIFEKGQSKHQCTWSYNGVHLEIVRSFVYLGMLLNSNGRWNNTHIRLRALGSRALHGVFRIAEHVIMPVEQQCLLFDTLVKPILNYGSELWGPHSATEIEGLHMKFCKRVLSVRKSASNVAVRGELGRLDFLTERKVNIMKFWVKIISDKGTLLHKAYSQSREDADTGCHYGNLNWTFNVKQLLANSNMLNMWNEQDTMIPSIHYVKAICPHYVF